MNESPTGEQFDSKPAPRYVAIENQIAEAIGRGTLPAGTILTEGAIAALFGTSRTPVRTAFAELSDRGMISRFDGRGFVVGAEDGVAPHRIRLTREMLGLGDEAPKEPQPASADRIASSLETSLAHALPFGLFRINEQAVADHFDVSRTVVRELLSRYQDRGLVRKDLRSHWVVGPLTARDVAHYFAIRARLEPLALIDSAPHLAAREISAMRRDIDLAIEEISLLDSERIDGLETDLHVRLLARTPNAYLLRMIHQSQIALVVNRVFASFVGARPFEVALREHAIVLEFVMRGSYQAAALALEEHLRLSAERTRQRLMAISVFPEPDLPRYLHRQAP